MVEASEATFCPLPPTVVDFECTFLFRSAIIDIFGFDGGGGGVADGVTGTFIGMLLPTKSLFWSKKSSNTNFAI